MKRLILALLVVSATSCAHKRSLLKEHNEVTSASGIISIEGISLKEKHSKYTLDYRIRNLTSDKNLAILGYNISCYKGATEGEIHSNVVRRSTISTEGKPTTFTGVYRELKTKRIAVEVDNPEGREDHDDQADKIRRQLANDSEKLVLSPGEVKTFQMNCVFDESTDGAVGVRIKSVYDADEAKVLEPNVTWKMPD